MFPFPDYQRLFGVLANRGIDIDEVISFIVVADDEAGQQRMPVGPERAAFERGRVEAQALQAAANCTDESAREVFLAIAHAATTAAGYAALEAMASTLQEA